LVSFETRKKPLLRNFYIVLQHISFRNTTSVFTIQTSASGLIQTLLVREVRCLL